MITARLRTHPRSPPVPAKFEFDRPSVIFVCIHLLAGSDSIGGGVSYRSVGRGFLSLFSISDS